MRKRVVYAGLIMLVIAIAVLYVSNAEAENAIKGHISVKNITVLNDSFSAMPLQSINATNSITAIFVDSNNALNEYLFNTSTFGKWKAFMLGNRSASGIHYATLLNSMNKSLIYSNKAVMSIILPQNSSSEYAYLVIDNTPGSNSSALNIPVKVTILAAPENTLIPFAGGDIAGVILLLAAIVIVIYGLVRKPKAYAQQGGAASSTNGHDGRREDTYIESLYKSIEANKKRSKRSKKGKKADENG